MGYTHYWAFNKPKDKTAKQLERLYQQAVRDCQRVILAYQTNAIGDDRLSGYSAHTPVGTYGGINVNGKGDQGHEDFQLPEHWSDLFKDGYSGMGFCKTARKPYDKVVTACLAVLKYRLGNAVDVSSDGRAADWAHGVLWARCTLRRNIHNPLKTIDNVEDDLFNPAWHVKKG